VSEVLILAKLSVHKLDEPTSERYYEQIVPILKAVDGFMGLGLWRGTSGDGSHLATYLYRDFDSADSGLRAISGQRSFTSAQNVLTAPADVVRCRRLQAKGQRITDAPLGSYMSMSMRSSEPGYGKELAEELERIFEELQVIPGFLGSYVGVNDALEEEIIGLISWRTEEAFRASVPARSPYEVHLFRRVI
jgi:heme-degrading monooxygenase HmoA